MTDDIDSLMYSGARGRYAFPTTAAGDTREETPRSASRMEINVRAHGWGGGCSTRGCVIVHNRAHATWDLLTVPCSFVRRRGVVVAFY